MLEALPERVIVLLDEALADFADAQPLDAALALLEDFPRLLVLPLVLEGLGPGRACASATPSAARAPSRCSSSSRPSSASTSSHRPARWRRCGRPSTLVPRRVERVRGERARLLTGAALARRASRSRPSQANFVWLEADGHRRRRARRDASTAPASASPAAARWATPAASASRSTTPRPRTGSCAHSTARWAELKPRSPAQKGLAARLHPSTTLRSRHALRPRRRRRSSRWASRVARMEQHGFRRESGGTDLTALLPHA